jgi:hypothetical protein
MDNPLFWFQESEDWGDPFLGKALMNEFKAMKHYLCWFWSVIRQ